MPVYRPVGNQLVRKEEFVERALLAKQKAGTDLKGVPLDIRGGEPRPFKAVDLNKPLLVEIRHVYTGQYPAKTWGPLSPDDMLVTSAVRSIATYNACPKAINFLKSGVTPNFSLRNPSATECGTPIVFYVPALTEANSIITIEVIFNRFDPEILQGIGSAFVAAAGIPLFAAHSTYLLAAGALTKLASKIAECLSDGKAQFTQSAELSFLRGGVGAPEAGFHILVEDDFDLESEGCLLDEKSGRVINKQDSKEYKGPHPYVVISLDGEKHDEYNNFVPSAASAALLKKFYHTEGVQGQSIEDLIDVVKLYNDLQYKRKSDEIEKQLGKVDQNSEEYKKLVEKKEAYLANLITDVFKA